MIIYIAYKEAYMYHDLVSVALLIVVGSEDFTYMYLIQERIMTRVYDGETFTNSQFLVFINRILAFCIAGLYVYMTTQPRHVAPVLQVLILLPFQYHQQLVPVRGTQVCQLPDTGSSQGVQSHTRHAHGQGRLQQDISPPRVLHRWTHERGRGPVSIGNQQQWEWPQHGDDCGRHNHLVGLYAVRQLHQQLAGRAI